MGGTYYYIVSLKVEPGTGLCAFQYEALLTSRVYVDRGTGHRDDAVAMATQTAVEQYRVRVTSVESVEEEPKS